MDQLDFSSQGLNRRLFIKGIGWITVGLLAGITLGGCESCIEQIRNRPVRRRLRTGSAEVDAALETYREAISLIKALSSTNAADTRGLVAQAGIHGTSGGGFNYCQHGTDHFFSWHRAYLVWFERICQEVTGDKSFGLPYWNWNQNPAIHPAFLDPESVLYMPRSNTSMAGQYHVSDEALNLIFSDTNFFTFSSQLEGTPHNRVHTFTGGTFGGAGSAMDPIFWMHHCMIDYCWAKWNLELDNDNTNDSTWLNANWNHFYDANGNPTETTAGATTLMPLLSYQYESSAIGSHAAKEELAKADFKKLEDRIRKGADIKLEVKQRIPLADTATISIRQPFTAKSAATVSAFTRILNVEKTRETIFASIGFASLPPTSDFFVRVFVNYPEVNIDTPITNPHFAGSFAFFGTDGGEHQRHGNHGNHQPKFLVNITPTIERLRSGNELQDDSELTIHLVSVPNGEEFSKPDAVLRLNNLELIITPVIVNTLEK